MKQLKQVSKLWLLMLPLAAVMLVWAFRRATIGEVLLILRSLQLWQMMVLIGVNLLLLLLFSARWWLILRMYEKQVSYLRLSMYRMIGAAVSYVTPGPQFGGEPVQVALLRKHNLLLPAAISSVFLDRSIELLANFGFLALGIGLLAARGLFGLPTNGVWIPAMIMIAVPAGHLAALSLRRSPLTLLLELILGRKQRQGWQARVVEVTRAAEEQMSEICRNRPAALVQVLFVTVLVWVGMVFEYYLALRFLGLVLNLPETVMALTAARLAFLTPLPAGLGVLEAGQVMAMEVLGYPADAGIAISVFIRARDILVAVSGLLLGVWAGLDRRIK
jgi:glycosyltransferase 2 family protein